MRINQCKVVTTININGWIFCDKNYSSEVRLRSKPDQLGFKWFDSFVMPPLHIYALKTVI